MQQISLSEKKNTQISFLALNFEQIFAIDLAFSLNETLKNKQNSVQVEYDRQFIQVEVLTFNRKHTQKNEQCTKVS